MSKLASNATMVQLLGFSGPVISSISPALGDTAGGTPVTIAVSNSSGCTSGTVGGVALTSFTIVDATHVSGVTGTHAVSATSDVTITNGNGTSTLTGAYEYWNPGVLSKCVFWLRGDLGVTQSASLVSSWATQVDSADGAKTVTAAGAQRPAYSSSDAGYNNKATLDFDGVFVWLENAAAWATALPATSEVYTVGEIRSSGRIIDGNANRQIVWNSGSANWGMYAGVTLDSTVACTTKAVVFASFASSGNSSLFVNSRTTVSASGGTGGSAADRIVVGAFAGGAGLLDGKVAEIAAFNAQLNATERGKLATYSQSRYGITVT